MDNDSGADFRQQQELEEYEQWLESEVCLYCYEPKNDEISCCGENHFDLGKNTL
jgi:hypothetical protein